MKVIVSQLISCNNVILQSATDLSANPRTSADLHDTLTTIEHLQQNGAYSGSLDRFFSLVELCTAKRPVSALNGQEKSFLK